MFSIKRMVERAVERALNVKEHNQDIEGATGYESRISVTPIANGYLICGNSFKATYCADHVAVAEFIVAQATRNKMGLTTGTQMDLFENAIRAGKVMTSIPYSGTIGTLDGHVHIKSKPDYL